MENKKRLIEQAGDILDKWDFFYGQRAGRELWGEKPREVQDEDIANFCRDLSVVRSAIVDAVEVVHGRWEENVVIQAETMTLYDYTCSECSIVTNRESNYCPNCGAKMDGERKEKDA